MTAFLHALPRIVGGRSILSALLAASLAFAPTSVDARTETASQSARTFSHLRTRSLEYRLNWGVRAIRADRAYRKGATGKGVTIALLDTGIDGGPADLLANVSDRSIDVVRGSPRPSDDRRPRPADRKPARRPAGRQRRDGRRLRRNDPVHPGRCGWFLRRAVPDPGA
ncbi:S8/S53 family peptidase [Allosphingosinicella deserti]|uniref:hypothetical protein n=1 Tax=Allosphingosinicella deserti TaxID=2116704 RepID=UPI001E44E2C8|nr:hypothetical protein [Sphingomonas deserti]